MANILENYLDNLVNVIRLKIGGIAATIKFVDQNAYYGILKAILMITNNIKNLVNFY